MTNEYHQDQTSLPTRTNSRRRCRFSTGIFDGVHIGHQKVIKTGMEIAQKKD